MRTKVCFDCGRSGPWESKGTQAVRCHPCRTRHERFRGGHYRTIRQTLPPPLRPCEFCGAREDLTYDHVVPISQGGRTVLSNLRVLCRRCNSRRGNRR